MGALEGTGEHGNDIGDPGKTVGICGDAEIYLHSGSDIEGYRIHMKGSVPK